MESSGCFGRSTDLLVEIGSSASPIGGHHPGLLKRLPSTPECSLQQQPPLHIVRLTCSAENRGYSAAKKYFYIRRNPVINICSRLIAFILFTVHRIHIHAWNNTPDMTFHFYAPYNTLQSFALATLPDGLTSLSHQYQHHHLMAIHIVQCTLYTLHSADCQCTACIAQDRC